VVCDGNSLTFGYAVPKQGYPEQLFPLLGSAWVTNFGVNALTTPLMTSRAAATIDPRLDEGVGENVLVAWEVRNDLVLNLATAATAYSNLVTYCQARQAAGWTVIVLTVLPSTGGDEPGDFEASRGTVNTNIRNNWATFADALCDVAANGNLDDSTDATYFQADQVHLKAAGYAVVAGLVEDAIGSL